MIYISLFKLFCNKFHNFFCVLYSLCISKTVSEFGVKEYTAKATFTTHTHTKIEIQLNEQKRSRNRIVSPRHGQFYEVYSWFISSNVCVVCAAHNLPFSALDYIHSHSFSPRCICICLVFIVKIKSSMHAL